MVRIEYDDYFEVVRVLGWCTNNEHRVLDSRLSSLCNPSWRRRLVTTMISVQHYSSTIIITSMTICFCERVALSFLRTLRCCVSTQACLLVAAFGAASIWTGYWCHASGKSCTICFDPRKKSVPT